ncbi:DUF3592 domain-containing protein [Aeromicrobium sp. UC242_57]|uniref:DUF3592 domain-containing protein n=1 Tax=Aeromicrobium sp. UC242_57 TaxID=3374624 RepID=UPI003790BBF2
MVVDVGEVGRREPRIEYRAPGGRRLRIPGPSSVTYTMGQQVAVLIDPLDPSRARLDVTEREAELVVTILLVTGSIVLVIGLVTGVVLM